MKSLLRLIPYVRRYWITIVFGVACVGACTSLSSVVPHYLGEAVDLVRHRRVTGGELLWFGLLVFALASLSGCFRFLMRRAIIDVSREVEFDFRNDFFRRLEGLDPTFYDGQQTGELMSRATNDIEAVRLVVGPGILYLVNTLILLPLVIYQMMRISMPLTAWSLLPLALLPALVVRVKRSLHDRSLEVQNQFGRLTTVAQENLAGVRVVKAYVQEESECEKFKRENDFLIDRSLALARVQGMFFPLLQLIAGFGLVVVVLVGGYFVIHERMQVGELVAMTILYQMLVWPLIAFGWVITVWQRGAAAMERIHTIFDAAPAVRDVVAPASWFGPPVDPRQAETNQWTVSFFDADGGDLPMRGEISVRALTFQYEGATRPSLRDVTVEVQAGGSLGIVGPVGSGKSTFAALIGHLYPVERGRVFIDGRDINDWPLAALRRRISLVFQEPFVFSESIAENVAFGRIEEGVEDSEVFDAASWAHLNDEVDRFPDRYETLLGERGINLSGGQKQRLTLARALVRDPRILIVDDSLSAVDTQTESQILANLRESALERTIVMISHRLSALSWCDQIIVLDDGRVVERGSHAELLALGGLYADLHRKQQLEEEVEAIG